MVHILNKERLLKIGAIFVVTLGIIGFAGTHYYQELKTTPAMEVVGEKVLIPGGQSVGIRMNVKGVLVVGLEEIETENGVINPGFDAGLQIGDMIVEINNKKVYYASDVANLVNCEKNEKLILKIQRKKEFLSVSVTPVLDLVSGEYKIGVWVKERIAGIGTLTFFDPQKKVYAALGHGIYETQTGALLEVGEGTLLKTEVKSVQEGIAGKPGEIRGIFYGDEAPIGEVKKNSVFGVYSQGKSTEIIENVQPMVIGNQEQVKKGKAYILTTIDGSTVEKFEIKITKVTKQDKANSKGIEIEVTDKRLLSHCGGIVQGMSGSPIIQNNRIIGAVTHVFVNNPLKGYGIFIEWMLREC